MGKTLKRELALECGTWPVTQPALLARLGDWGDRASWQEFFQMYARLIYALALKSRLSAAEAEDVVQETMLCVAKQMKAGQYDSSKGSFRFWLVRAVHWRITEQVRRRPPGTVTLPESSADEPDSSSPPQEMADPEAWPAFEWLWATEWVAHLVEMALERVRLRTMPKQYQIFDLSALHHRPMAEVRSFLHVGTAQVYLARHRVGRILKQEVAQLMREEGCPIPSFRSFPAARVGATIETVGTRNPD